MTSPTKLLSPRALVLSAILAVGAWLRLWHLGSPIPFDDEWHAIAYVVDHDLGYLFTHYTRLGANSVPHNLYLRLAYRTIGLSEWSIAFPSLLCGILLLWFYPRWVWDRCGAGAGLVSAVVLALHPFLIFYSRFARPYAPLLLVEFLAITSLVAWAGT
jgi:predicted membrane-bound mannosyltransferase